jgi:hypothetical protein
MSRIEDDPDLSDLLGKISSVFQDNIQLRARLKGCEYDRERARQSVDELDRQLRDIREASVGADVPDRLLRLISR